MTAPETVVVTGTANTDGGRWGDYASMSVDPFDDCTFWYVSQYFAAPFGSGWSTQIASAVFPAGSGAGQCPPTTCVTRPGTQPLIGSATVPGDNQITVNWGAVANAIGYRIYRGTSTGSELLLASVGAATAYITIPTQGGVKHAYRSAWRQTRQGRCADWSGRTSATRPARNLAELSERLRP
jgi:hypothetical protein